MKGSSGLFILSFLFTFVCCTFSYAVLPGSGTSIDPYRIETPAHFQEFSNYGNSDEYWSAGVYTELCCNISLNNVTYRNAIIGGEQVGDQFESGFQGVGYSGNFNGKGHMLSNFILMSSGGEESYLGLFGVIQPNACVCDIKVENALINVASSTSYVAVIAAVNYGIVDTCEVDLNLTETGIAYNIGGVVGYNFSSISKCYANGLMSLSTSDYIGGICGLNEGTITQSASDIDLAGDVNVGGICGGAINASVFDCYCTGSVTGDSSVAGISGQSISSIISRCYSTAAVTADDYDGEIAGLDYGNEIDCYYLDQVYVGSSNDATSLPIEQMYLAGSFNNWDFVGQNGEPPIWTEVQDDTPKLNWQVKYAQVPSLYGLTITEAETSLSEVSLVLGNVVYEASLTVPEGEVISFEPAVGLMVLVGSTVDLVVSSGVPYSGGDGSVGNPFLLGNPDDIMELHDSADDYDKHFLLIDDISMEGYLFDKALMFQQGAHGFEGVFDGAGYVISGIIIGVTDCDSDGCDEGNLGLFGVIGSSAEVKNVSVEIGISAFQRGYQLAGGLCGTNSGKISNCHTTVNVNADRYVGGICGKNESGGIIEKSVSKGIARGWEYVGGICGLNYGNISLCCSNASISLNSGGRYAGGFCGYNYSDANINNCYSNNTIDVGTSSDNAGGFCGQNDGRITASYSASKVLYSIGDDNVNYFASSDDLLDDCYFLNFESYITYNGIAIPLTASEMKESSSFIGWDFANTWYLTMGNYPQIRTYGSADINQDNSVDLVDLAIIAGQWLSD